MPPMLELENVVKFYGAHQALGPVTATLPEGSCGLLGPNGAGKTTLVRILLGLVRPNSGTVRVLGEEMRPGTRALKRRIGYVPEGDALFPDLTGVQAVAYAGRLIGMGAADAMQRAHQVIDYVQLGEARYRRVTSYSTGMRQRLKLAQALVHDPDLLVLDEPTEGVDPEARLALLDLLHELQREHGIQTLLSTHILPDVERLATHALVLNRGQIAALGSLKELKSTKAEGFLVRVNGPLEQLAPQLTAHGLRWEAASPNVRVHTDDPRAILAAAQKAGLVVRHLAPLELTLGEAFEQAVGGTERA